MTEAVQLTLDDYVRELARQEQDRIRKLDRWDCSVCAKRVSRQSGHAHLRVRRPEGWDHSRCHP